MTETQAIRRWREDANRLEAAKELNVPLNVLIGESVEASKFTTKYWEPTDKRPGLSSAGSKLPVIPEAFTLAEKLGARSPNVSNQQRLNSETERRRDDL